MRIMSMDSHIAFLIVLLMLVSVSREIIENEKNGLIVPAKDANALYVAMARMLIDAAVRSTMKQNARQMIKSRFEKNFVQNCQIEFYKSIEQQRSHL